MDRILRDELPRLPLQGKIDLTYRCNNRCLHCWLLSPDAVANRQNELTFSETRLIVDEARQMGCQTWYISGGEPMLRPDFCDIFDYITRKCVSYTLNTNGTLITPQVAELMTRTGKNLIALYGATADIHDKVTRNPGSFEATLRGMAYLKEAGADFIVQLVPMRANYHQFEAMENLAQTLSPLYRVGASWLWLSCLKSKERDREIAAQRLDPAELLAIDEPSFTVRTPLPVCKTSIPGSSEDDEPFDDRLFASCVEASKDFYIDPYGRMTFCCFIKDPALMFDLRKGSFEEAWETFIPSLADTVRGGREYRENCGTCDLRRECHWCAVYGYLEHGRFSAKVDYLCQLAEETRRFTAEREKDHLRFYQIAGVTIQLTTDFPMSDDTFIPAFNLFRVNHPGEDAVSLRLSPGLPKLSDFRLGQKVYDKPPWKIYESPTAWVYMLGSGEGSYTPYSIGLFDHDYRQGTIFITPRDLSTYRFHSLTTFPTDQIFIAALLPDRRAFYLHAAGFVFHGEGLLFVGHSEAGKSTMCKLLRNHGDILCDDRIIVRRWADGFKIHGTWSHGELPDVSPAEAPLKAVFFIEKAVTDELIPLTGETGIVGKVASHIIKAFTTEDWWHKTLDTVETLAREVPVFRLRFNLKGGIVDLLEQL